VQLFGELQALGVDLYLHQQSVDSSTPSGRALLQMSAVFAEFERAMLRERVFAGLARARAQGKRIGRPRAKGASVARICVPRAWAWLRSAASSSAAPAPCRRRLPAADVEGVNFPGRAVSGLHRHALMTTIAYAFLQHHRLAAARREKKNQRAAASTDLAGCTPRHPRTLRSTAAVAMPVLSKMDLQ
jgi:hypothetical protein